LDLDKILFSDLDGIMK